jgi:hypothetical protein
VVFPAPAAPVRTTRRASTAAFAFAIAVAAHEEASIFGRTADGRRARFRTAAT